MSQFSESTFFAQWQIASEKESAFAQLVQEYKEKLYWHIRRMVITHDDADDVLQETFIKAWRGLENFRQDSSLYTWLYRIATNNCLTFLQKKQTKQALNTKLDYVENTIRAQENFDANAAEWKLQLALASLPAKQKQVFDLRYYNEMPYEEMSQVLDTSVGALKASYHHAAKKIQEFILNHHNN